MQTMPQRRAAVKDPSGAGTSGGPRSSWRLAELEAVTDEMLRAPAAEHWLIGVAPTTAWAGAPCSRSTATTPRRSSAWRAPLAEGENMASPLIHSGVMYLHTCPDTTLALDASSDLHLLALDAGTGELLWDHAITTESPKSEYYQLRAAPLVAGNKVIQGMMPATAARCGPPAATTRSSTWSISDRPRPTTPRRSCTGWTRKASPTTRALHQLHQRPPPGQGQAGRALPARGER
jgi:alcohol dehydrogenase (cytochrome c)